MKDTFQTIYCTRCGTVDTAEGEYRLAFLINSAVRGEKEARQFVIRAAPKEKSAKRHAFRLNANGLVAKMLVGGRALDTYLPEDYLDLANGFLVDRFSRLGAYTWFDEKYITDRLCDGFFAFLLMEMARAAGDLVSYSWVAKLTFREDWELFPFPKTGWMPWQKSL